MLAGQGGCSPHLNLFHLFPVQPAKIIPPLNRPWSYAGEEVWSDRELKPEGRNLRSYGLPIPSLSRKCWNSWRKIPFLQTKKGFWSRVQRGHPKTVERPWDTSNKGLSISCLFVFMIESQTIWGCSIRENSILYIFIWFDWGRPR